LVRIVVLDGYTLNPGDLSWDGLMELGDCEIYDRTPPETVTERAAGAEVVLTNKAIVSRDSIERLPDLKYVGLLATGYNVVDVAAATERNIVVTNVPAYGTRSVAQFVFAHVLALAHHVDHHTRAVREGRWTNAKDFTFWDYPQVELADLTIGIIGFGRIGRATAQLALAFGMNVLACDTVQPAEVPEGINMVDLETVFRKSDVVSLHCPLTPQTQNLVNATRLSWMKPSAILINASRGPLVDERALADALKSGRIAGAGVDVLSTEPPAADNPLFSASNCRITPHIAWATTAARKRLLSIALENVKAFLEGRPQNVVNGCGSG